jgi:hypothetical protein
VGISWRAAAVIISGLLALQSSSAGFARASAVHEASTITCVEGAPEVFQMRSTDRLPEASGVARVECKGGTTIIELELDSMKPASLFGGDYNTYVLWVVPPGGRAQNLGEMFLDGSKAVVEASTPASLFAILVSAEPHYLVRTPSAFLVFENNPIAEGIIVHQPLLEGQYNFGRSTLQGVREAKGKVHSEVRQAFTAVRLAQRAGAADLAGEELEQAKRALDATLAMWRERRDRSEIAAQARQTIKLAVAAQRLAHERALLGTREKEGSGGGKSDTQGRDLRGSRY